MNVFLYNDFNDIPFGLLFYLFAVIVLCRAFMITSLTAIVNIYRKSNRIPFNYQAIMIHSGLRGAIAYSLSVSFPSHNRDSIVMVTMWIILLTIFTQGCTTYDMLRIMHVY